jgi:hypothetical protein
MESARTQEGAMTYDTFESLKVGNMMRPIGKKRTYPVVRIGKSLSGVRTVYVCLNPIAVRRKREFVIEFGIFAAEHLDHTSHYINWDKVS